MVERPGPRTDCWDWIVLANSLAGDGRILLSLKTGLPVKLERAA
jgi:hypothetical protein